jgi:hypothetical protein
MAVANVTPIFSKAGDIQWGAADGNGGTAGPLKTANTAKDGGIFTFGDAKFKGSAA